MKFILTCICGGLTACGGTMAPEHSRERIVGLMFYIEKVESQARLAPAPAAAPLPSPGYDIQSFPQPQPRYYPDPRYTPKGPTYYYYTK